MDQLSKPWVEMSEWLRCAARSLANAQAEAMSLGGNLDLQPGVRDNLIRFVDKSCDRIAELDGAAEFAAKVADHYAESEKLMQECWGCQGEGCQVCEDTGLIPHDCEEA